MATNKTILNISFKENPEFNGKLRAVVFDSVGNLLAEENVKKGKATIALSEKVISRSRVFISPIVDEEEDKAPSLTSMERLKAFEIVAPRGKFPEKIRLPDMIIGDWIFCLCWIRGQVIKSDNGLPVCNAKVHICEVDRLPLILEKLPDPDIFRLREDLLDRFIEPIEIKPPIPEPDPIPFGRINIPSHLGRLGRAGRFSHINQINRNTIDKFESNLDRVSINPQPEPPGRLKLPVESLIALESNSVQIVRESLIQNYRIIFPFLCWFRWWNWYRCDELRVITTDANGRFSTVIAYPCNGDKPDLYFWVEYKINNVWEPVYKPRIACATYWNYTCGKEVTIRVSDTRVVACNDEPDLPGCVVQILSIGRQVSMSEVRDDTVSSTEGLTTSSQPFGGKLEPRVWFSRTTLRDGKNIKYYRWSYRRLTEGNGTPLSSPTSWEPLTRMTVRHYAKPDGTGDITHEPYVLGPQPIGSKPSLFEIKPAAVPAGGIEWSVVDEREDLASSHFVTTSLGNGTNACNKALDAAGKYELKLELFKDNGNLVNWTTEGVDLRVSDIPAPFGTNTVTTDPAPNYNRIKNAGGDTVAFRMVLRIDNNCCKAQVEAVTGTGLTVTPCGFIEYNPGATVNLHFKALHPNGFANLDFDLIRGVSTHVPSASAAGKTGIAAIPSTDSLHVYNLTGTQDYRETFSVVELLGGCDRAAFAERLRIFAIATNGYGRLSHLDASDVDGFALSIPC